MRSFRELSKGKYVLLNHICKIREKVIRFNIREICPVERFIFFNIEKSDPSGLEF